MRTKEMIARMQPQIRARIDSAPVKRFMLIHDWTWSDRYHRFIATPCAMIGCKACEVKYDVRGFVR